MVAGIWFGVNINSAKNDMETIQKDLKIRSREVELTSRELEFEAKNHFKNLSDQFKSLEANLTSIETEHKILQEKYTQTLSQNETLFKELESDNRSLSAFSKKIKETIGSYADQIELAKQGADQRRKDVELILKKRNEQLEAVQESTVLLLEYLALMQSKSNVIPNPNVKKGIGILNKILVTLVPDEKERTKIVKRINETIEHK